MLTFARAFCPNASRIKRSSLAASGPLASSAGRGQQASVTNETFCFGRLRMKRCPQDTDSFLSIAIERMRFSCVRISFHLALDAAERKGPTHWPEWLKSRAAEIVGRLRLGQAEKGRGLSSHQEQLSERKSSWGADTPIPRSKSNTRNQTESPVQPTGNIEATLQTTREENDLKQQRTAMKPEFWGIVLRMNTTSVVQCTSSCERLALRYDLRNALPAGNEGLVPRGP
jgi:hypothetical protein